MFARAICLFCIAVCATFPNSVAASPRIWPTSALTWSQQLEWTNAAWTGDNAPYHKARLDIERAAMSNRDFEEVRTRYYNQAHKHPTDPLALYCWAYATYEGMLHDNSRRSWNGEFGEALDGFYAVESPRTYDYDRVRYLITESVTTHAEMVPVAKRLLNVDPNDLQVAYHLASAYLYEFNPARVKEALDICNRLNAHYPNRAPLYALTGFAYVMWYDQDKDPAHARAAVENYEKYLKLAAPTDPFRKRAKQIIAQYKPKMRR